jgi:hypothetical protein
VSTEAMKLALEAFKLIAVQDQGCGGNVSETEAWRSAKYIARAKITEISQAIEQAQKQEPVAWMIWLEGNAGMFQIKREAQIEFERRNDKYPDEGRKLIPLYTSQSQRQPLTLEQLREHWQVAKVLDMTDAEIDFADYVLITRDVEALYGITGEQK